MNENEQRIADMKEIVDSLNFCKTNGKKCKKCKERDEYLKFIRSSIAICLQFFINSFEESGKGIQTYFV